MTQILETEIALKINGLCKSFDDKKAVDELSLSLNSGEFYAFLGANGAGKTTSMRMICGLLAPDKGDIEVFGKNVINDPYAAKSIMAWLPDEPLIYEKLSPLEYLEFVAGLWNIESNVAQSRAEDLLKWFELWDVRHKRCEGFSRGMKQKTAIAAALLHEPKLLLLDEPFSGLDAAFARQLKDLLVEKTKQGATIVLTTHVMEIAERLAQKIGIIHNGRLMAEGNLDELRAQSPKKHTSLEDIFIELIEGKNGLG